MPSSTVIMLGLFGLTLALATYLSHMDRNVSILEWKRLMKLNEGGLQKDPLPTSVDLGKGIPFLFL